MLTTLNSFTLFRAVLNRGFQSFGVFKFAEQVRPGRSPFHMPTGLADGLGLESSRGIAAVRPAPVIPTGELVPPHPARFSGI
jgi:hypothetical protein